MKNLNCRLGFLPQQKIMEILEETTLKSGKKIQLVGDKNGKVLVIGVFHGDEPQGKFLIENYIKENKCNNLMFIPCLNPDGLELHKRTNANGVDLNRNFATKNWQLSKKDEFFGGEKPQSEIETQFVSEIIEKYKPKMILTLHAPYKIVNYDGPAKEIAQKISKIIDYPVEGSIGYPTPGSFGTYAGTEKNIPVITLELDEECPCENLVENINKIFNEISLLV